MSEGRRSWAPLVIAGIVGIMLIIGARFVLGRGSDSGTSASGPDNCTQLMVAASSEKAGLLKKLAQEYNGTDPRADGRCVRVSVESKSSGGAAQSLIRGWDEAVDGPRPDVWSPASSSWAVLVQQGLAEADKPNLIPKKSESVAQTPLVIAMPRPMAEALGWPKKQIGWADLAALAQSPKGWAAKGHPEWGRFKLGKTNPNYSTSGLNATIAAFFAATGLASDLTVKQVNNPKTRQFVKKLESSVVHYGDTTLTFLENMANEAKRGSGLTYVSAVTVEEKSVLDYNNGNPTGNPETAGGPKPAVPLVAIYPKDGTLLSDNPWIVLNAAWVDPAKRAAASDFLTWLREPAQQQQFMDAGFRSYEGKPGEAITEANGLLPAGPSSILSPPAPVVLAAVKQSWDALRKRAHVLLIIDVSGSMGEAVPTAGASKLELAQRAAIASLDGFAPDDEIGLWVFSTGLGDNDEPYQELVPIGPAKQTIPKIKQDVARLVADGGTGLYATMRASQAQMLKTLRTERINAIVLLSDGRNEYPQDVDLDGLLRQISGESMDTSVRIFTIGYGESADTEALKRIAEASRGRFYDASDPRSLDQILANVLSNF